VKRTLVAVGSGFAMVMALAMPATAASPGLSAQAMATRAADALVAANPSALYASAGEQFVQKSLASSAGLQYVSYERTYQGLPVIGGDFVVVTDSKGAVQDLSVAQGQALGSLSTTPSITAKRAIDIASGQLTKVDAVRHRFCRCTRSTVLAGSRGTPA